MNGENVALKLPAGTYRLKEVSAPSGYIIASNELQFVLNTSGVTAEGTYIKAGTKDGKPLITVYNEPGAELPHTGDIGTGAYRITGLALMLGAALILKRKNH